MKLSFKNLFKRNVTTKSNDSTISPIDFNTFIRNSNLRIEYNTLNSYQIRNLLHGLVTTCIDARAQIFAQSVPLIYKNVAGNDTRKNKVIEEHPFVKVLYDPNPFTSYYELMTQTISNLDAWGNSYWYIHRNNFNLPTGIELLDPDPNYIKYIFNDSGFPIGFEYKTNSNNNYQYSLNSKDSKITIPLNDVIHFKYAGYNPRSLYGLSIIQKNVSAIEIYHYENEYQKDLLKKGGTPPYYIKSNKRRLEEQDRDKLRTDWKEMYAGLNNVGNIPIMQDGLELIKLSFNPMEIGYLESKKVSKNEILNMFRVHPAMLGDADGVNKANGYIGKNTFLEDVLTPIAKMIDAKITQFIKRTYNPKFYFEQKLPFRLNEEQEIKRYDLGLTKGCITKNEYRTFMDYDTIPVLDDEDKMFFNQYTVTNTNQNQSENNNSKDSEQQNDTSEDNNIV